jgi:pilus assembly protein Flp/PilA
MYGSGERPSWPINQSDRHAKIAGEAVMQKLITRFMADESGATAIEYGLIAAGIAVVIIGAVNSIGTKLGTAFGTLSNEIK